MSVQRRAFIGDVVFDCSSHDLEKYFFALREDGEEEHNPHDHSSVETGQDHDSPYS